VQSVEAFFATFRASKSMKIKTAFLLFAFATLPSIALSQDLWELEQDRDGVKVYTRLEEGSLFKSFKAMTVADATSAEIVDILKDVNGYVNWFAYTEKVELLENSSQEKYVYMETRFPWPFGNEDMIYRMTFATEANATTKVTLAGVPAYSPPVKGIARMKGANGYILLNPAGNKTEVTYYMHSELGGEIPVWMANQYIHNLPYLTISNLRKIASGLPSTKASVTQDRQTRLN
jgi:hypothetical protein